MSDQTTTTRPPANAVRVLKDTRRTLLQLVANIDAALEAVKETASSR